MQSLTQTVDIQNQNNQDFSLRLYTIYRISKNEEIKTESKIIKILKFLEKAIVSSDYTQKQRFILAQILLLFVIYFPEFETKISLENKKSTKVPKLHFNSTDYFDILLIIEFLEGF